MKWLPKFFSLATLCFANASHAADTYQDGHIYDVTSSPEGLLIRLQGNVVPTTCPAGGIGWMVIPEANKTMVSLAMAMLAQGKTRFVVYVGGTVGSYCKVVQLDPHEL